jgi:hypothetical protein
MATIVWATSLQVYRASGPPWVISSGPRHVRVEAAIQSKADLAGTVASRRLVTDGVEKGLVIVGEL